MTTPLQAVKIVDAYKTQTAVPIDTVLDAPTRPSSRGADMGADSQQPLLYAAAASWKIDQTDIDPILDPIHWDRVT